MEFLKRVFGPKPQETLKKEPPKGMEALYDWMEDKKSKLSNRTIEALEEVATEVAREGVPNSTHEAGDRYIWLFLKKHEDDWDVLVEAYEVLAPTYGSAATPLMDAMEALRESRRIK